MLLFVVLSCFGGVVWEGAGRRIGAPVWIGCWLGTSRRAAKEQGAIQSIKVVRQILEAQLQICSVM